MIRVKQCHQYQCHQYHPKSTKKKTLTYEIDDGLDQEHGNNLMIWEITEIITKK